MCSISNTQALDLVVKTDPWRPTQSAGLARA